MTRAAIASAIAAALAGCAGSRAAAPPAAAESASPSPARTSGPTAVGYSADHPTVAFRIHFLAGSVDDPPGKEGLTALAAHLMVEGGTASLTSAELQRALFPMAAELDVSVDKEITVFEGRCPKTALEGFRPILEEVIQQPRFDPREFERIRARMVDFVEKALRSESDEALAQEALSGLLYGGHPYGHYTGGTVQGLKRITLDDVKAQYRRVFVLSRLTVAAAGAGEGASLAADLLDHLRGGHGAPPLPEGEPPPPVPAPQEHGPRFLLVEKASAPTAISMGFTWDVRRGDPDFVPLAVAVSALGEHRQGSAFRLFRALREERGLNYGDYAYPEHFEQAGGGALPEVNVARTQQEFTVWIRPVEPPHKLFAIRAALYELDRWAREGLAPDELASVKRFLAGYTLTFAQTDSRRLGYALDDRFYGLSRPWLDVLRARLGALTLDEVNAAIRRHVELSRLRIAVATHDAAALRRQILSGAPSPIVYAVPKPAAVLAEDKLIERFPLGARGADDVQVVKAEELFEK